MLYTTRYDNRSARLNRKFAHEAKCKRDFTIFLEKVAKGERQPKPSKWRIDAALQSYKGYDHQAELNLLDRQEKKVQRDLSKPGDYRPLAARTRKPSTPKTLSDL